MPTSASLYARDKTVLTACEVQPVPSQHLLLLLSEPAPQEIPSRPHVCVPKYAFTAQLQAALQQGTLFRGPPAGAPLNTLSRDLGGGESGLNHNHGLGFPHHHRNGKPCLPLPAQVFEEAHWSAYRPTLH